MMLIVIVSIAFIVMALKNVVLSPLASLQVA